MLGELPNPHESGHEGDEQPKEPEVGTVHPHRGPNMEVLACHATQGVCIRVALPKHAKFKHLKRAIARRLGSDDIFKKGLLTNKIGGVYKAHKDESLISDVRQVMVAGVDFGAGGVTEMDAFLSDGEVTDESVTGWAGSSTNVMGTSSVASASSHLRLPSAKGVRNPIMTRRRALALQRELLEGFTTQDFQERLRELMVESGAAPTSAEFHVERQELFLSVQRLVLPNYGFEGTLSGVYRMMGAMGPFVEDPEFSQLAQEIHTALGIHSPPETWGDLSKSCQKLEAASAPKTQERRSPPPLVRMVAPQHSEGEARRTDASSRLSFDRWPIGKYQPFKLFIAGTWNDFCPAEMQWQNGLFVSPITVGLNGWESFQMLKDGSWSATIYPSVPDAGPFEQHAVCGPDDKGHGKNWQIGRYAEDEAAPGAQFAIVASVDKAGSVRLVHWQHLS
mmetsp:Transcript_32296/g.74899  ORF Transcript_32296/g.74899 Transcript_32296/m.74899 type:complete len:449 (-) Transcript_32296:365-1711(-)